MKETDAKAAEEIVHTIENATITKNQVLYLLKGLQREKGVHALVDIIRVRVTVGDEVGNAA